MILLLQILAGVFALGWGYLVLEIAKDAFADHSVPNTHQAAHMRPSASLIRCNSRTGFVY